ncbi:hypothetical protein DPSP01_003105 [Paraphaeosphaeria sporulosa]|uniref:Uncharacterized protein n=1 Tax=Paraphaeosphaeria sporulosa TaxID=1460663 RepID=A0A177C4G0_9PLEO|nr:uncharacterized protein CC84DRAFT_1221050 [Paraphaeosphaeria sporulosa]OAG01560.1 hypothetical protein CC84DRAFT_1221050 [Paraphaeosphaeria sporulosa]
MLFKMLALLALLALVVMATPITEAATNLAPTPSINDALSIVARAPMKEFTQNMDVNDPGPGGRQEKGGPKEESWIDKTANAKADCTLM